MKDPAFLFYSKDFYEGTRMMLPEERACYIDLLIYQHQNGIIPDDLKRLKMYCAGCDEQTIKNVLNQKFNQTVNGWLNKRLELEQKERSENKPKKIASATLAGLISSKKLTKPQIFAIKKEFKIDSFIFDKGGKINELEEIKKLVNEWFNKMVNQMVNNIANADANANANASIKEKGVQGEKQIAMPFDSDRFENYWKNWKEYKKLEHGFKYKSAQSEQSALISLSKLADGEEDTAIRIIMQSMENGWKGFFELKNLNANGNKNRSSLNERLRNADAIIDQMYG